MRLYFNDTPNFHLSQDNNERGSFIRAPRRRQEVVGVVKLFCHLAVRRYGYTGASVARFLRFITTQVNRYAASGDLLNGGDYF